MSEKRIRPGFRWALTMIAAPFVAVIVLNVERLAEARGWDHILIGWVDSPLWPPWPIENEVEPSWIDWVTTPPALGVALLVVGLTSGVWLDTWLRRADAGKPTKTEILVRLGYDCRKMSSEISDHLLRAKANDNRYGTGNISKFFDISDLQVEIVSLNLRLKKNRVRPYPYESTNSPAQARRYSDYLDSVGTLLRDEHFKEARKTARQLIAGLTMKTRLGTAMGAKHRG